MFAPASVSVFFLFPPRLIIINTTGILSSHPESSAATMRCAESAMPGWAGVCFDSASHATVAVARHFAKSLDVYDGDRRVRTMNTLLNPYAVAFVPANTDGGGRGGGGGGAAGGGLLAVAEGNQLSLWRGCARAYMRYLSASHARCLTTTCPRVDAHALIRRRLYRTFESGVLLLY